MTSARELAERLTYGQKLIAEAIIAHFGEQPDVEDERPTDDTTLHDVWDAFDAAFATPSSPDVELQAEVERLTEELVNINQRFDLELDAYAKDSDMQALRDQISPLQKALESLTNSADGLSFREGPIRAIVGNTNWNVLREHIDAARAALSSSPDTTASGGGELAELRAERDKWKEGFIHLEKVSADWKSMHDALLVDRDTLIRNLAYQGELREAAEARLAASPDTQGMVLAALEPFAKYASLGMFDKLHDDMPMTQGSSIAARQVTAGDFKRAKAAYAALTSTAEQGEAMPASPLSKETMAAIKELDDHARAAAVSLATNPPIVGTAKQEGA